MQGPLRASLPGRCHRVIFDGEEKKGLVCVDRIGVEGEMFPSSHPHRVPYLGAVGARVPRGRYRQKNPPKIRAKGRTEFRASFCACLGEPRSPVAFTGEPSFPRASPSTSKAGSPAGSCTAGGHRTFSCQGFRACPAAELSTGAHGHLLEHGCSLVFPLERLTLMVAAQSLRCKSCLWVFWRKTSSTWRKSAFAQRNFGPKIPSSFTPS